MRILVNPVLTPAGGVEPNTLQFTMAADRGRTMPTLNKKTSRSRVHPARPIGPGALEAHITSASNTAGGSA